MTTSFYQSENTLTVFLSGEIDHHGLLESRDEIDRKINSLSPKKFVLDFKDVTFMDSSGIGLIMGRYKLLSSYGGKLYVNNASNYLKRVMKLAGVDSIAIMDAPMEEVK